MLTQLVTCKVFTRVSAEAVALSLFQRRLADASKPSPLVMNPPVPVAPQPTAGKLPFEAVDAPRSSSPTPSSVMKDMKRKVLTASAPTAQTPSSLLAIVPRTHHLCTLEHSKCRSRPLIRIRAPLRSTVLVSSLQQDLLTIVRSPSLDEAVRSRSRRRTWDWTLASPRLKKSAICT